MGRNEENASPSRRKEESNYCREYIKILYDKLVELGYLYKDLYEMTLKELEETFINRRKGLGYEVWRLASLTRSPLIKNFPSTPEEACPELYPKKEGIRMPSFLMEKAIKRGVI